MPRLVVTDVLESPALVGVVRPVVLIPTWMADEGDAAKLDWAMRHELAHCRRLDPFAILVRDVVTTLIRAWLLTPVENLINFGVDFLFDRLEQIGDDDEPGT